MPTSMFPQDVIEQILLQLTVKILLRFRCVSKSICDLIDSPYFSQTRNRKKLIIWKSDTEAYAFDFDDGGVKEQLQLISPIKSLHNPLNNILGSCKGLLLLFDEEEELTLWNPFTKRYKQLTKLKFKESDHALDRYKFSRYPVSTPFFYHDFGLGYDDATDDYKVVMVHSPRDYEVEVWVYSLRFNSWMKFKDVPFVNFDGASFILCRSPFVKYPRQLVALDFANETFYILLPIDYLEFSQLHVLDNLILSSSRLQYHHNIRLFRGVNSIRLYRGQVRAAIGWRILDIISGKGFISAKPLYYWEERGKILLEGHLSLIILYDLEKKTCEYFPINGISPWKYSTTCLETLVSLGDDGATAA